MKYFWDGISKENKRFDIPRADWEKVGVDRSKIFELEDCLDDVVRKKGKLKSGWYWMSLKTYSDQSKTWRGKELHKEFHQITPVKVLRSDVPYSIEGWGRDCKDGWVSQPSNLLFSKHSLQRLQERYRPHQLNPEDVWRQLDEEWIEILCDPDKNKRWGDGALLPHQNGAFVVDSRIVSGMDIDHVILPQVCKTPFFRPQTVARPYVIAITFLSTYEMSDHQLEVYQLLKKGDHRGAFRQMIRDRYRGK